MIRATGTLVTEQRFLPNVALDHVGLRSPYAN